MDKSQSALTQHCISTGSFRSKEISSTLNHLRWRICKTFNKKSTNNLFLHISITFFHSSVHFQLRMSQLRNDLGSIHQVVSPQALLGDCTAPGAFPCWKLAPALSQGWPRNAKKAQYFKWASHVKNRKNHVT